MKIVYTESALSELEKFQDQQKAELESFLKEKKFVFGDDILEVTASDVREASRHFRVTRYSSSPIPITSMLLRAYMVLGVVMAVAGIFYNDIIAMLEGNPMQLALVLSGLAVTVISFVGSYYFRMREARRYELEKRYLEHVSKESNKDS